MSRKVKAKLGFEGHYEEASLTIPDAEPAPWDADSKLDTVGKRQPRIDAVAKVTGKAKYTRDIVLPGMLHGRILRANVPSGKIAKLDVSAAKALGGVRGVWTERVGRRILFGGQEVAAVAATTAQIAEEALALIRVEYEALPWVVDVEKARAPGAPQVFPAHDEKSSSPEPDDEDYPGAKTKHEGNVRTTVSSSPKEVDIDKAFAEAEVIVEGTYRTQVQTHSALETHGSLAAWEGDRLIVYSSTQATFGVRDQVAQALGLAKDKVTVRCEFMGGGFGAKFNAGHWSILAAKLAKETGAPVKIMLTRDEEHVCTGNRPDSTQWLKIGAKKDGTLVAAHLKSYGSPGVGTGAGTAGPVRAIYNFKAWKAEESDVFTNAGGAQPFRAPGHPQGCFALEQAIDELALKLKMDPIALRKKNVANPVHVAELDRGLSRVPAWSGRGTQRAKGTVRRGVGVACGVWYKFINPGTQAEVDIHTDGTVEIKNGAQDIGTGTRTWMAQITAEELGLPTSAITVRLGDTVWPHGPGSGGSTTTPSLAPAVRAAAYQAKKKLLEIAARQLKVKADQLQIAGGKIFVAATPSKSLTFKQACARIPGEKMTVVADRAAEYEGYSEKTGGVQFAEVEVDTATGNVRVLKVTAIQDCGRALNPLTAESQINGGVIQGVSYALFEERVMDRHLGLMINTDLEAYKIAFAADCPEIAVELFDVSKGFNNTGAVGLGEPPTVPTAAAIANAVYDAIGVRIHELPITPARILAALGKTAAGGAK